MDSWAICIIVALGYVASFLAGLFFAKYKYSSGGLADSKDVCDRVEESVGDSAERINDSAERITDLIEQYSDIEDLFKRVDESNQQSSNQT